MNRRKVLALGIAWMLSGLVNAKPPPKKRPAPTPTPTQPPTDPIPPPGAPLTIYYVDAVGGLDANNGLSTVTAWQTTNKVEAMMGGFVAGDQILFKRGQTFGVLSIYGGVAGAAGNPIIYGAYDSGARPIFDGTGQSYACVLNSVSYVTFNDLQFFGGTDYGVRAGAYAGHNSHINFNRCRCYSNLSHGFYAEGSAPFWCDDFTYTDCDGEYNGKTGFYVFGNTTATTGFLYTGCNASYNGQTNDSHGFSVYNSVKVTIRKCQARFTNINPATGMANAAHVGGEGIGFAFDDFATDCLLQHSLAHHNAGPGIQASHQGTNCTVHGNTSVYNGSAGVYINGNPGTSNNTIIYNNTICYNAARGIDATSGPIVTLLIKNNIIAHNTGYGLAFGAASVTGGVVDNNLFYNNSSGDAVNVSPTNTVSTDPKFFNSAVNDFSLIAGSGAINAGLNLGFTYRLGMLPGSSWPSSVLTGDQNSHGSAWEIGAYISATALPLAQACL